MFKIYQYLICLSIEWLFIRANSLQNMQTLQLVVISQQFLMLLEFNLVLILVHRLAMLLETSRCLMLSQNLVQVKQFMQFQFTKKWNLKSLRATPIETHSKLLQIVIWLSLTFLKQTQAIQFITALQMIWSLVKIWLLAQTLLPAKKLSVAAELLLVVKKMM